MKKHNNERGSAVTEAAATIGFFLFFVIAALDLFRLAYNAVAIQFVMSEAIRIVNVVPVDGDFSAGSRQERLLEFVADKAESLHLEIEAMANHVAVCSESGSFSPCFGDTLSNSFDLGEPNELVALRFSYPVSFFWGNSVFTVNAIALGRNEPF